MQLGEQPVPTITAELLEREMEVKNPTTSLGHLSLPHLLLWRGGWLFKASHCTHSLSKHHKTPLPPCGWAAKAKANNQQCQDLGVFEQGARCSSKGATPKCGKHLQGFAARDPSGAQSPPAKLLQHL